MTKKVRREPPAETRERSSPVIEVTQNSPRGAARSWQANWDDFWYAPQNSSSLIIAQRVVSTIAAIWFLSMLSALDFWWTDHGLVAGAFASQLELFTEGDIATRFRWSPLWMTDSPAIISVWCIVGIGLAVLSALNVGGRISRILLMLSVLLLCQRMSWSVGLAESTMVAFAGYLAIAKLSNGLQWSHRFSSRLIHVHTWLMLCAALANQLANATWWQGEAVWWLTSGSASGLLEGRRLLTNTITHGITAATLISIVSLWPLALHPSRTRLVIGALAGISLAIAYIVLASQWLYGSLLIVGILLSCNLLSDSPTSSD